MSHQLMMLTTVYYNIHVDDFEQLQKLLSEENQVNDHAWLMASMPSPFMQPENWQGNLAVWQIDQPTARLKFTNIKSFLARVKHHKANWWE